MDIFFYDPPPRDYNLAHPSPFELCSEPAHNYSTLIVIVPVLSSTVFSLHFVSMSSLLLNMLKLARNNRMLDIFSSGKKKVRMVTQIFRPSRNI